MGLDSAVHDWMYGHRTQAILVYFTDITQLYRQSTRILVEFVGAFPFLVVVRACSYVLHLLSTLNSGIRHIPGHEVLLKYPDTVAE